jgi:oligosaccharide repeat unit polymerase
MDSFYLLLWLCYCLFLWVALKLSKNQFSPAIAFFSTWVVSIGLLSIGSIFSDLRAPPLPKPAFQYLLLAGACFLFGVISAHLLTFRSSRLGADPSTDANRRGEDCFNLPALKALSLAALAGAVLHARLNAPGLQAYLNDARAIREQLADPDPGRETLFGTAATIAALIVIPVALAYWLRYRRIRWWMTVAILSAGTLALLNVGKFLIIFVGLAFINMVLLHRGRSRTARSPLGPMVVVALLLLGVFAITEELRGRTEAVAATPAPNGLLHTIYIYATGYVPAFGGFYEEFQNGDLTTFPTNPDYDPSYRRFGNQTFSGIYRALAKVGLVQRSASNHYEGAFNVYTIYRDLIMDFGTVGSLAGIFIVGVIATLVFRICDPRKGRSLVLLSLLMTQMEFSLTYSLLGFIFFPIILIAAPALVRWRWPARRTMVSPLGSGLASSPPENRAANSL